MNVDTGRARAAWHVSMNALAHEGFIMNARRGKGETAEAIAVGKSQGEFTDHTGQMVSNKWVEMVNGVDYIIFLEYGYSRQAPFGMVRVSMREMSRGQLPKTFIGDMKKEWNSFYYVR